MGVEFRCAPCQQKARSRFPCSRLRWYDGDRDGGAFQFALRCGQPLERLEARVEVVAERSVENMRHASRFSTLHCPRSNETGSVSAWYSKPRPQPPPIPAIC